MTFAVETFFEIHPCYLLSWVHDVDDKIALHACKKKNQSSHELDMMLGEVMQIYIIIM